MKKICDEHVKNFFIAKHAPAGVQLKDIAQTFGELQQKRHTADYDNSYAWTRVRAESWIDKASVAFDNWRSIRSQPECRISPLFILAEAAGTAVN
jgi:hypothetical protein